MSILDFAQAGSTADTVAIYDQNFDQFIPYSRPMKCSVTEPTKNMEHPIETGSVITDHRVIMPVEIDMALVLDADVYYDQYQQMKQAMKAATLFYIGTRTGIYRNMMITDIPHEESPDQYDTITVNIKFKEVQLVTATFEPLTARKVQNKDNASTKDRGQQNSKTPTDAKKAQAEQSWLKDWTTPEGF
mgnify:FL=1